MPDDATKVSAARRLEPRRVDTLVKQLRANLIVALSQPLLMSGASLAGTTDTYGTSATAENNATTVANELFDRVWMRTQRRNGNAVAARVEKHMTTTPFFHHLVDPGTATHPATLIFEDMVAATLATAVVSGVAIGFCEHLTPGDPTTLVGVGFKCGLDHIWHSFVQDCPTNVAPVTVVRDTTLSPVSTTLHRLTIIIDGMTKTIYWLIDRTLVDSFTPAAALGQMTPLGPKVMWCAAVPALGDAKIRYHGGGLPCLRVLLR